LRHHHHHCRTNIVFFDSFGDPFYWWGYPFNAWYPYDYYPDEETYAGQPVDEGPNMVVQVQRQLARAGYYHGAIDGVMGPATARAIRGYERAHNLPVDGALSDQLLQKMKLR
jgi:hypothetical protein